MSTMGEKIREARLQRGMTQADLGGDLVSASMISQIEADRTKPSYPLLTSLANRLGLPPEYFMSDLDEQFALAAYIRLAEYYLLTQQPRKAIETLTTHASTSAPGLHRNEYLLLMARAHRDIADFTRAVHFVEDLRELAFRLQDQRLMFSVLKESGYVEYGMDNLEGAIFEWTKALEIGEEILADEASARMQNEADLAELYFSVYKLYLRMPNTAEDKAAPYLRRALELCTSTGTFRDIAGAYVKDAYVALDMDDAGSARTLVERAVDVLKAAQLVELYILVQGKCDENAMLASHDPWVQAAIATATANPTSFVEAELTHIKQYIAAGDADSASRRIQRCFEIIQDYSQELPAFAEWAAANAHQLHACQAQVESMTGNIHEAIRILEGLHRSLSDLGQDGALLEVCAHLVIWYVKINNTERAYALSSQMEELTQTIQNRASQLG